MNWEEGETGRWGDGEMGRRGGGKSLQLTMSKLNVDCHLGVVDYIL